VKRMEYILKTHPFLEHSTQHAHSIQKYEVSEHVWSPNYLPPTLSHWSRFTSPSSLQLCIHREITPGCSQLRVLKLLVLHSDHTIAISPIY
jgi:hypothetical protein